MAIRIDATKKALTETYVNLGTFFGLALSDPGNDAHPMDEADPAGSYARSPSNWSVNGAGVATGPCAINADGGTYAYAILCSDSNGDNMIDNCPIGGDMGVVLSGAGVVILEPTYTQT
jgi:hypothetical protein